MKSGAGAIRYASLRASYGHGPGESGIATAVTAVTAATTGAVGAVWKGAADERRDRRTHFIAIDVHGSFCEGGWVDQHGQEGGQFRVATNIPALAAAIERVPKPRRLVSEEGPLADWLCRHLRGLVDEMLSCDPWQNSLISKGGEPFDYGQSL